MEIIVLQIHVKVVVFGIISKEDVYVLKEVNILIIFVKDQEISVDNLKYMINNLKVVLVHKVFLIIKLHVY